MLGANTNIMEREPFSIQQEVRRFATVDGVGKASTKESIIVPNMPTEIVRITPPSRSSPPRGVLEFAWAIDGHRMLQASFSLVCRLAPEPCGSKREVFHSFLPPYFSMVT